jgi:hypothetical protein
MLTTPALHRPRNYVPKNPMQNPPHYPQEPFAGFQDPALYPKMDLDTLFYIFYYHAGTYEQSVFSVSTPSRPSVADLPLCVFADGLPLESLRSNRGGSTSST